MADDTIPRRQFLLGAGIAGTAAAAGLTPNAEAQTPAPAPTPAPANEPVTYLTLSALEVEFVSAVADTMIPADALKALEAGKAELGDFDTRQFFDALLNLVMEGFFADPIYGGNRDKAAWKMIGYPGLPALYANSIDEYRHQRYLVEPRSIVDFS